MFFKKSYENNQLFKKNYKITMFGRGCARGVGAPPKKLEEAPDVLAPMHWAPKGGANACGACLALLKEVPRAMAP